MYHLFFTSFFFFQAEDGIRDKLVTGVQTCALPILPTRGRPQSDGLGGLIEWEDRGASGGVVLAAEPGSDRPPVQDQDVQPHAGIAAFDRCRAQPAGAPKCSEKSRPTCCDAARYTSHGTPSSANPPTSISCVVVAPAASMSYRSSRRWLTASGRGPSSHAASAATISTRRIRSRTMQAGR